MPIEFYIENWNIIADDFVDLYKYIFSYKKLCKSQRKGLITIFPKDGDQKDLKNWRPISLLCVDYKIISKLLARRMQPILEKVLDINQFCSVQGKSIINCNMIIRDIVYYINNEDEKAAFLKIDWHKAFDLVNVDFLFRVLLKMGFGENFVWLIEMLYCNIESAVIVNNHIGRFFNVTRSVRQGCPLSMILFVIYQETFYAAIRENPKIEPLILPDHSLIKLIGYADDTNLIVKSEESLLEIERVINDFEKATNSSINRKKTKIFGMGKWKNKSDWPIHWISPECKEFNTLGIFHCNNYTDTLAANWNNIAGKIEAHIRIIHARKLTLFQRASYINICILSKAWYVAHIYPMNECYANRIRKSVFKYLWCGNYEPIKRKTICMSKDKGGLGVFDCKTKADGLLLNSFLKSYINERGEQGFLLYYCQRKLQNIISRNILYPMIFSQPSPYYVYILSLVSKCENSSKFPAFKNKFLYQYFLRYENVTVEFKYPLFNWGLIWKNFHNSKIHVFQKEFLYKHLHDVLMVKKRLYEFRMSDNNKCGVCENEQSALHLFYLCNRIAPVFQWFLGLIDKIVQFKPPNNIKFIYFDFEIKNIQRRNVCILLLCSYLHAIWLIRLDDQMNSDDIKTVVLRKYFDNVRDMKYVLGDKIPHLFGNLLEFKF